MVTIASIPLLPFTIPLARAFEFPLVLHIPDQEAAVLCLPAAPFAIALGVVYHRICREMEIEADYLGLKLMAEAGFDIRQASNFWRRVPMEDYSNLEMHNEQRRVISKGKFEILSHHRHVSQGTQIVKVLIEKQTCFSLNLRRDMR